MPARAVFKHPTTLHCQDWYAKILTDGAYVYAIACVCVCMRVRVCAHVCVCDILKMAVRGQNVLESKHGIL